MGNTHDVYAKYNKFHNGKIIEAVRAHGWRVESNGIRCELDGFPVILIPAAGKMLPALPGYRSHPEPQVGHAVLYKGTLQSGTNFHRMLPGLEPDDFRELRRVLTEAGVSLEVTDACQGWLDRNPVSKPEPESESEPEPEPEADDPVVPSSMDGPQ